MQLLMNHRSIRKYKDKAVSDELLQKIIGAGTRASTTGNMQLYSVVVTRGAGQKAKIAPLHFKQRPYLEAPVSLTICADVHRFNQWCNYRNADAAYSNMLWLINAVTDASLFAQNICLAAEAEDFGICYLGTALYNAEELIDELKLPQGVFPLTVITLGYPDEHPPLTDRLPLQAVIHQEKYQDYDEARVNELYAAKETLESSKKFVAENKKSNLAQVFTDVRYSRKDSEFFSKKLTATLRKQGFEL